MAQENEEGQQGDDLGQYQIVERKQWEQRYMCMYIYNSYMYMPS